MGCIYTIREITEDDYEPWDGGTLIESYKSKSLVKQSDMFLRGRGRKYVGLDQEAEGKWSGDFDFIWMGDPQIGFDDMTKELENTTRTVEFINKRFETRSIKFVVVCGDHTHSFENIWDKNDSLEVNRENRKVQLYNYKNLWSKLNPKIPLVCVCGNHDVGNIPTEETISLYTEEFGDDYLAFWAGGVKFLVINSQLVQHPEGSQTLASQQWDWLDKELKEDKSAPIVFAHIPPFCWHADENDTNFNWPKVRRRKWLDRMVEAGVRNMYCAHYHRRAEGTYKDLKVMTTAAVGTTILTKELPEDVKHDEVQTANFKISREGFGGLSAKPEVSGLYVVTVSKEGPEEKWMSIGDIRKITGI